MGDPTDWDLPPLRPRDVAEPGRALQPKTSFEGTLRGSGVAAQPWRATHR